MQTQPLTTNPPLAFKRSTKPQPLAASQLEDALLTMKTASETAGLSQATLYRLAPAGRLKLVKMGTRCTRIRAAKSPGDSTLQGFFFGSMT